MNNFYVIKSDELYHFGVKGMKWGGKTLSESRWKFNNLR